MPPTRTIMPPAKPQKTERTHEENQERAYIAASRRSDRSLEARVESARRASEIHKRRTGRSLRVTEQDVINEEMYEEEDDDLPLQYRRLTAHLQTNNAEFNRKLAAYLTNHVAMRSALEQSIHHSYAQQGQVPNYMNGQQLPNQYSMFPSPMLSHQNQQQQVMQPPQSPSSYRHAPYPSPKQPQQGIQSSGHQRSHSIAVPSEASVSDRSPVTQQENVRRLSMPSSISPAAVQSEPSPSASSSKQQRPSFPPGSFARNSEQQFQQQPQAQPATSTYDMNSYNNNTTDNNNNSNNIGPFSTTLPNETQGLLGGNFMFPDDPLTSNMMMGSQMSNNLAYHQMMNLPTGGSANIGKSQTHASYDGLTSTLLPASAGEMHDFTQNFHQPNYFTEAFNAGSKGVTPAGTPGAGLDGDWSSFLDDNAWEQPSASQTSQ